MWKDMKYIKRSKTMKQDNINRRDFLKKTGTAALAVGGLGTIISGCTSDGGQKESSASSGMSGEGEMTYRTNKGNGDKVSILGYGCMRWPMIKDENGRDIIDQAAVDRLIDYAIEHGVNYFDTAPVYLQGQSESATGISLKRYPRESYFIATKLSNFSNSSKENSIEMYRSSLKNLQTDYIDYYLLHSLSDGNAFNMRFGDTGIMDFLAEERKAGRIRNLGFSFHGTPEGFDELMALHEKYHWDFVQIQLNYVDWTHASGRNADAKYLQEELDKRGFYLATLDYIAYAQKVLYNNENPTLPARTLVTDYVAVYADNATVNGADSFLLTKGAGEVALSYTGSGVKAGWSITTYGENGEAKTVTQTSDNVSLSCSAVITPIVLDFEIASPSVIETFENSYKENLLSFADGTTIDCPSFGDYVKTSYPNTATYTNTTGESVAEVVEYVTASGTGKALRMFSPGRINKDGSTNSYNRSHTAEFKIMESVVPADKVNAVALEFDLKLGVTVPEGSCAKGVSSSPIQLIFRNYPGDGTANTKNAYFQINPSLNVANKTLTVCGVEIPGIDEFVRIKLVADIEDEIIHIYANGVLLGSEAPDQGSDPWAVFAAYGIAVSTVHCYNANGMAEVYLDNVSFYNTYSLD